MTECKRDMARKPNEIIACFPSRTSREQAPPLAVIAAILAVSTALPLASGQGDSLPERSERPSRTASYLKLVENPYYRRWASFAPGSWVQLETTTRLRTRRGMLKTVSRELLKLVSVDDKRVVIRVSRQIRKGGRFVPAGESEDIVRPRRIQRYLLQDHPRDVLRGRGRLKIAGKVLECTWERTVEDVLPDTIKIRKVWFSPRVPGHAVKMKVRVRGPLWETTETVAIAFEAVQAELSNGRGTETHAVLPPLRRGLGRPEIGGPVLAF